jgi:hypothetical protein
MLTRIGVFVALLGTLLGGWLWGASSRQELDRALRAAELRNDLLEAHASLLGARMNLCDADFGAMSLQLEIAQRFVGRAGTRLGAPGLNDEPKRLDLAGISSEIDQAKRLAARLNAGPVGPVRAHDPAGPAESQRKP